MRPVLVIGDGQRDGYSVSGTPMLPMEKSTLAWEIGIMLIVVKATTRKSRDQEFQWYRSR